MAVPMQETIDNLSAQDIIRISENKIVEMEETRRKQIAFGFR